MKGFAKKFKDLPDYILKITYQIWEDKDVEAIRDYMQIHQQLVFQLLLVHQQELFMEQSLSLKLPTQH